MQYKNTDMFDRAQYYIDYNQKRREDPERRARYNEQVRTYLKNKYNNDPEWAENTRRKRREHYAKKKELKLQQQGQGQSN